MLSLEAKKELARSEFIGNRDDLNDLVVNSQVITVNDIIRTLFGKKAGADKLGNMLESQNYEKLEKLGVSPKYFDVANEIYHLTEKEPHKRNFLINVCQVIFFAKKRQAEIASEVYKASYIYLCLVKLLKNSKIYRDEVRSLYRLLIIPRNIRQQWPNIVLLNYSETLLNLKNFLGSEVIKFSSKELGGRGVGVLSVRKHKVKFKSGAVSEVVEKVIELGSESSKTELEVFRALRCQQGINKELPFPKVYLIKESEHFTYVYMECLSGKERNKKTVEFYENFSRAIANFNFFFEFNMPTRTLCQQKKVNEVLGKLEDLKILDGSKVKKIQSNISSVRSENSLNSLQQRPSHGDVHLRNTVYSDRVYFIDFGGFVNAPIGHDLNFLLWLYPSRVAEITGNTFLDSQERLLTSYMNESRITKDSNVDASLARRYIMETSCFSWLSRALKKGFVVTGLSDPNCSSKMREAEREWLIASEQALKFLFNDPIN